MLRSILDTLIKLSRCKILQVAISHDIRIMLHTGNRHTYLSLEIFILILRVKFIVFYLMAQLRLIRKPTSAESLLGFGRDYDSLHVFCSGWKHRVSIPEDDAARIAILIFVPFSQDFDYSRMLICIGSQLLLNVLKFSDQRVPQVEFLCKVVSDWLGSLVVDMLFEAVLA